jgi:hypothetical protein
VSQVRVRVKTPEQLPGAVKAGTSSDSCASTANSPPVSVASGVEVRMAPVVPTVPGEPAAQAPGLSVLVAILLPGVLTLYQIWDVARRYARLRERGREAAPRRTRTERKGRNNRRTEAEGHGEGGEASSRRRPRKGGRGEGRKGKP